TVTLGLMHQGLAPAVNINVTDGSSQEAPGFDPTLAVVGCNFRFSFNPPNASACSSTMITIGVYNSNGVLATDFAGTVSLSTSTAHGSWLSTTGNGALTSGPGNGTGTYTF